MTLFGGHITHQEGTSREVPQKSRGKVDFHTIYRLRKRYSLRLYIYDTDGPIKHANETKIAAAFTLSPRPPARMTPKPWSGSPLTLFNIMNRLMMHMFSCHLELYRHLGPHESPPDPSRTPPPPRAPLPPSFVLIPAFFPVRPIV